MVWIRKRDRRTGVKNKSAKRTGRAVVKPVAKAVQFDPLPDVETLKSVNFRWFITIFCIAFLVSEDVIIYSWVSGHDIVPSIG